MSGAPSSTAHAGASDIAIRLLAFVARAARSITKLRRAPSLAPIARVRRLRSVRQGHHSPPSFGSRGAWRSTHRHRPATVAAHAAPAYRTASRPRQKRLEASRTAQTAAQRERAADVIEVLNSVLAAIKRSRLPTTLQREAVESSLTADFEYVVTVLAGQRAEAAGAVGRKRREGATPWLPHSRKPPSARQLRQHRRRTRAPLGIRRRSRTTPFTASGGP